MNLTYKKARFRGRGKGWAQDKVDAFETEYKTALTSGRTLVCVDESGFDQRPTSMYGYAPKGSHAIIKYDPNYQNKHHTLLMAIDTQVQHHERLSTERMTASSFADFMTQLPHPPGATILLDNAPIHKTRLIRAVAESKGYILLFTPPYSPQYNPIEHVFGNIKQRYKRLRATVNRCGVGTMVTRSMHQALIPGTIQRTISHVARAVLGMAM
eukprot:jgi/Chrzof1/8007/UNPLg00058.t1